MTRRGRVRPRQAAASPASGPGTGQEAARGAAGSRPARATWERPARLRGAAKPRSRPQVTLALTMTSGLASRPGITPRPGTPPALAGKLSDEQLLAQNTGICMVVGSTWG